MEFLLNIYLCHVVSVLICNSGDPSILSNWHAKSCYIYERGLAKLPRWVKDIHLQCVYNMSRRVWVTKLWLPMVLVKKYQRYDAVE
jgi:hypothetical protein